MNFQHHYSSLQCHMILQKSFQYADLVLKKHFWLLSALKQFCFLIYIVSNVQKNSITLKYKPFLRMQMSLLHS